MKNHVVRQGECLSAIAKRYGFYDYRTIYDHPANANLKQNRPNPNLLAPGDDVFIPSPEVRSNSCATGAVHEFAVRRAVVVFRLKLVDDRDRGLAKRAYVLVVGGGRFEGWTDDRGLLEHPIPAQATEGELTVWLHGEPPRDGSGGTRFQLRLGSLAPVDESSGVQARLNNLGYDCGAVDGIIGPATRRALRDFQQQHRLAATGESDAPTRAQLARLHDGV